MLNSQKLFDVIQIFIFRYHFQRFVNYGQSGAYLQIHVVHTLYVYVLSIKMSSSSSMLLISRKTTKNEYQYWCVQLRMPIAGFIDAKIVQELKISENTSKQ